jgi:hypothetical protein
MTDHPFADGAGPDRPGIAFADLRHEELPRRPWRRPQRRSSPGTRRVSPRAEPWLFDLGDFIDDDVDPGADQRPRLLWLLMLDVGGRVASQACRFAWRTPRAQRCERRRRLQILAREVTPGHERAGTAYTDYRASGLLLLLCDRARARPKKSGGRRFDY